MFELLGTNPHEYIVFWSPGRVAADDLKKGVTLHEVAYVNHGADEQAQIGALKHQVPEHLIKSATDRASRARVVQGALASILASRQLCPPLETHTEGYIRGELTTKAEHTKGDFLLTHVFEPSESKF